MSFKRRSILKVDWGSIFVDALTRQHQGGDNDIVGITTILGQLTFHQEVRWLRVIRTAYGRIGSIKCQRQVDLIRGMYYLFPNINTSDSWLASIPNNDRLRLSDASLIWRLRPSILLCLWS